MARSWQGRLLIIDCLHTDDTEGHGGPQADGGDGLHSSAKDSN